MGTPFLSPYADPDAHARISGLIRAHSSNDRDVRRELLRPLTLTHIQDVLDLGCGFGFWAEELAARVAPGAMFIGLDACGGDEASYLRCVESRGRRARFVRAHLVSELPFADESFDLILAAYSLYFFVGIIPEVARVLQPGGVFLAVTHSEESFTGLLGAIGMADEGCPLLHSLRTFSSERGGTLLGRTFARVTHVHYMNTLTFGPDDLGDLLAYLSFKLPLVRVGVRYGEELPESFRKAAALAVERQGRIVVEKDDTLFACSDARRSA